LSFAFRGLQAYFITFNTNLAHLGDALHSSRLLPYLCDFTRGGGPKPFALRPDSKRRGGHVIGAQQRWRELRAQGAQIDAAARTAPPRRRLETVPEATSAAKKPLGLVWVLTPSYSITTEGLKKVLEGKAYVHIGGHSSAGSPSCVVLYAGGMEEDCLDGMGRIRERYPDVPLLVFGSQLDLGLAWAALKNGAHGFVHAQMHLAQVVRAVEVVQKGELAAPRQLLGWYFLSQKENPNLGELSARQREILELVVEGLSNAQIAGRLYLTESTIKQHLRAVYKELGVHNRTQAAKTMREHAGGV
jgi:DNA-binding NarL/FixJ family response regulator